MVKYEGLFFDKESIDIIKSLEKNKLEFINDEIHCTFKYKPNNNEIFNDIVGKEFEVYLVGYGSDGMNSGFEIELPKELLKYYINYEEDGSKLKIPHITASISKDAKSNNTKNLKFIPLPRKYKVKCKFGFSIIDDNENEYLSYDTYTE